MYFASFVINVLAWTFAGIALGFFLHKGIRRYQNSSVFIGGLASLSGGVFSSMTHGMFPEIGVDFFNLTVALGAAIVSLYLFAPNTRASIVGVTSESIAKTKNLIESFTEEKAKSPYFTSQFWNGITKFTK